MAPDGDSVEDEYASRLPCPAQLALALMVVRSKPPLLSIEDHIDSLRRAFQERTQSNHSPPHSFDAVNFWRGCYERSESERLKLLDEVLALRHKRETPQAYGKSSSPKARQTLGKRKRDAMPVSRLRMQSKNGSPDAEDDLSQEDMGFETEDLDWPNPNRQLLLRGFRCLRYILRLKEPDPSRASMAMQSMIHAICRSMQPSEEEIRKGDVQTEEQSIDYLCRIVRHVYPSILEGLEVTGPEKSNDGEQCFPAASAVVRLFQAILGRLHKCALDDFTTRDEKATMRKKGHRHGKKPTDKTPPISSPNHARLAKALTGTLVRMVTGLDASNNIQCEILEGILCAFLDHVGSSLSLLVFGDAKQNPKDSAGILPPRGLLDVAHLDMQAAAGSAKIEGPHLVFILRKFMKFLHQNSQHMSEESLLLFTVQKPDTTHPGQLGRMVQATLQKTLLRGVYGDDDDMFYTALRRDETADADGDGDDLVNMIEESRLDADSADWFVEQLWELLGWDILSGHSGH